MVFDRSGVDGNTFGVSGLLFLYNLVALIGGIRLGRPDPFVVSCLSGA